MLRILKSGTPVALLLGVFCLPLPIAAPAQQANEESEYERQRREQNEAYNKQVAAQNKAYEDQVTAQNKAYEEHKAFHDRAYEEYKKQIEQNWKQPEVSTPDTWVSYDEDKTQKTKVDFKKGEVTIEKIVDADADTDTIKQELQEDLQELPKLTYEQVYEQDQVAQQVEQDLQQEVAPELLESQEVSKEVVPIFASPPDVKKAKVKVSKKKAVDKSKRVVTLTYSLRPSDIAGRIKKIIGLVTERSEEYGIQPALVLAIIENESAFDPLAKSPIPAYGLMQIVPKWAGLDAIKYLYGQPLLPTPEFLYSPKNNIHTGVIYLFLLQQEYLKDIKDDLSRFYCTIADYNTRAGNVARAFTGKEEESITNANPTINSMSAGEVHNTLLKNLPASETRIYLKKILKSFSEFSDYFTRELAESGIYAPVLAKYAFKQHKNQNSQPTSPPPRPVTKESPTNISKQAN